MTMTDAPPSPPADPEPGWGPLDDDTSSTPLVVTALLVIQHSWSSWMERTFSALADLEVSPDRLVLVDATPQHQVRQLLDDRDDLSAAFPDVSVVTVPSGSAFAAIVDTAVEALPRPGEDAVVARRVRQRARKRQVRPRDRHEWFWLLHEDTAPDPDALDALTRVVGRSERIGIAGCKVVELRDRDQIVNVGLDVTRTGRHVGSTMLGEPDQGQYDDRHDVLAVSSAGMLIRRDVYLSLGGFDPAFDGDGDGLDLCWRTHLMGHQVVVVPQARVSQDLGGKALITSLAEPEPELEPEAEAEAEAEEPTGEDPTAEPESETPESETPESEPEAAAEPESPPRSLRRHGDTDRPAPLSARTLRRHRQVALARCSWFGMPFVALWTMLSCTALGVVLLLVKRPRHAFAELGQATAPLGVRRVLGARARFGTRGVTRRRDLDALFVPLGAASQHAWDAVRDAVSTEPSGHDLLDDPDRLESGPVSDESGALPAVRSTWIRRTLRHAGLWMTVSLAVASGFMWRHLLTTDAVRGTAQGLDGGQLRPFDTDSGGVWRLWRDQWVGPGLGSDLHEQPYLPVLAALARGVETLPWVDDTTTGATVITWLLLLAMPLSGVTAYLAGRAATRAQWPRAVAGLVWASLATLTAGVSSGRIGPVVAHILLPLVLAGALSIGRRTAGAPVTFGTVLAAALMGAFAPVLLVATTVIAFGVVLVGTGWARLRGAFLLVVPWLLLGPWTVDRIRQDWRVLLAGPGALRSGPDADPWQLALLHPGGAGSYLALLSAPVLALGVLGLLRRRPQHGRTVVGLGLVALLGLGAALAASHVTVTAGGSGPRSPWPGPALDLCAAALLGAALLAGGDIFAKARWQALATRWRTALAVGLVLALGWALGLVALVGWTEDITTLEPATPRMPAVAEQMSQANRATRMLSINVGKDGSVTYSLDGSETGLPARDLDVPIRTSPVVARGVASLLTPGTAVGGQAHDLMADLDVGFVGVTGPGDRAALSRLFQTVDGLSPMASNRSISLWRVDALDGADMGSTVSPSRLRLTLEGQPWGELPSAGPHGRSTTRVPEGPEGRRLVVSESGGWARRAHVSLNGHRLTPLAGQTFPTYAVPAGGGRLHVEPGLSYQRWRWVQGALLFLVVFLAVPFGNARSRRNA
ncbi:glycosyltransferase [Luteipulveratus mongoliensis]|uniref:Glycosyltransferase 2-like domain-containing protein n=1 Tax=Luteipulveratus mongoliensis TaxID=571913 RepID=A0A0K1JHN5_9MICO|nr:glycosyltransferase [Luteipulveratus mongoliensis]AKU16222.1 hypothetical protein VV02_10705 [Luteipulveratus mongoliensis]